MAGVATVEKNGPGATRFKVGQRVVGIPWPGVANGNGTWQQYYTAPEDVLVSSNTLIDPHIDPGTDQTLTDIM